VNDIFREWFDNFVVVYINDILIYSGSLDEHEEEHLRKVFQRLKGKQVVSPPLQLHLFLTASTYTTIVTLEPCALNAGF